MEVKQEAVTIQAAKCPVCGSQYPASYETCPYCGGKPLGETPPPPAKGGKRVKGGKRLAGARTAPPAPPRPAPSQEPRRRVAAEQAEAPRRRVSPPPEEAGRAAPPPPRRAPGREVEEDAPSRPRQVLRVLWRILSLCIIAAAIYIVTTKALPYYQQMRSSGLFSGGQDTQQTEGEGQGGTIALQVALTETDIILTQSGEHHTLTPDLTPIDPEAALTWTSSDSAVASVDGQGVVTAVTPGVAVITVALPNGATATCNVRCNWTATGATGSLALNRVDFTLRARGESFTMEVVGAQGEPVWSVADESVATITAGGTVTAQGEGVTVVTAQVDGETLTCTVRCNF